jgi:hypothetical protein
LKSLSFNILVVLYIRLMNLYILFNLIFAV